MTKYKNLRETDIICEGDQWYSQTADTWIDCLPGEYGQSISIWTLKHRRPIPAKPNKPTRAQYIFLEPGDVIKDGDEFFNHEWRAVTTTAIGLAFGKYYYMMRRRVE